MDAKVRTLVIAVIVAAILWFIGGFVVNNVIGIVLVLIGITIVGLAVGNLMNTPEPVHHD